MLTLLIYIESFDELVEAQLQPKDHYSGHSEPGSAGPPGLVQLPVLHVPWLLRGCRVLGLGVSGFKV